MSLDVEVCEEVVEEVAEEFTDDTSNDGGEVEEGCVRVIEEVGGRTDELRYCCDDADGPGEEDKDEET